MRPEQRFLNYVKIWSTSQAGADCVPSTECQFALARQLVAELKELGIADAEMDAHGYVYGHIPASSGMKMRYGSVLSHIWIPVRIAPAAMYSHG